MEEHNNQPKILFKDYNGYWKPLSQLYYSTSSNVLCSQHPESCIKEVISYYCPQCLSRFVAEEMRTLRNRCSNCFQCMVCDSALSTVALSPNSCVFQCGYCYWRSDKADQPVVGNDKADLISKIKSSSHPNVAFGKLLEKLQEDDLLEEKEREKVKARGKQPSMPSVPSIRHNRNDTDRLLRWGFEDLDKKISQSLEPRCSIGVGAESQSTDDFDGDSFSSHRCPLLAKQLLRCRQDVELGKHNILIQPKTFPLDGDSSLKVQRGKWWVIDSSAILEIPTLTITRISDGNSNMGGGGGSSGGRELELMVTNPKDVAVDICLSMIAPMDEIGAMSDPLASFTLACYEDELLKGDDDGSSEVDPTLPIPIMQQEDCSCTVLSLKDNVAKLQLALSFGSSSNNHALNTAHAREWLCYMTMRYPKKEKGKTVTVTQTTDVKFVF